MVPSQDAAVARLERMIRAHEAWKRAPGNAPSKRTPKWLREKLKRAEIRGAARVLCLTPEQSRAIWGRVRAEFEAG